MLPLNIQLIDRDDLTIQEKMCCIVLARFSLGDPTDRHSLAALARSMGCSEREARKALDSIQTKGLLIQPPEIELGELPAKRSRVLKKGAETQKHLFQSFEAAVAEPPARQNLPDQLAELRRFILEPVTDATLRILINMADGDIALIRKYYSEAVASHGTDVFESLMHSLQHASAKELVSLESPSPNTVVEEGTQKVLTQINQHRIAELYRNNKTARKKESRK